MRRSYPRGRTGSFSFSPVLSPSSARSELGRAESPPSAAPATAHHPASIRRTRSRADSPSTHSDHPRARPSPYPGRIEHRRRPPSPFPSSFAIAVELPLPAFLRPIQEHGEHPSDPLMLSDLFPLAPGTAAARTPSRCRPLVAPHPGTGSCATATRTGATFLYRNRSNLFRPPPHPTPARTPPPGCRAEQSSALQRALPGGRSNRWQGPVRPVQAGNPV